MSNLMNNNLVASNSSFAFPVHPLYEKYISQWVKCSDVIEGSAAIKAKGEIYLPRLSTQNDTDYASYKNRAVFFGISSRLLNTNVGVIVRRTPSLVYSKYMENYFSNDNINVLSFNEVRRKITRELTLKGRVAVLIDINSNDMPIPKIVPTEAIINWSENEDNIVKSILIATEVLEIDPTTFVETKTVKYFRLEMRPKIGDSTKQAFTVVSLDDDKTEIDVKQPSLRGRTFDHIPLYCINPFGVNINPIKPPMMDIVDINLSHYMTSADLENGRHFVGLPTPWVTGATSDTTLRVGSEEAWIIPSEKAKVGYLEFMGQGLDALYKALQEKQSQMSQFSAQLMDTSTRGSEAEGTVRLRYSSDAANLTDIALSTEACLQMSYSTIANMLQTDKPNIELNKDFLATKMTHNELRELTKSLVDGAITEEVFMYNLERGEMIPDKK